MIFLLSYAEQLKEYNTAGIAFPKKLASPLKKKFQNENARDVTKYKTQKLV